MSGWIDSRPKLRQDRQFIKIINSSDHIKEATQATWIYSGVQT